MDTDTMTTPLQDAAWITTFTGRKVQLLDPQPRHIDVLDIAHALSNVCRWGGHCNQFYSVAEHCVHVSYLCSDPAQGLLHDAAEAYLGDVTGPLKRVLGFVYKDLEDAWMRTILMKLGMKLERPDDLEEADGMMAMAEARFLMNGDSASQRHQAKGYTEARRVPMGWAPERAKHEFLRRWDQVKLGVGILY